VTSVRIGTGILTTFVLAVLIAPGAVAQTQDFRFHWAPSPLTDEQGQPLPEAVGYHVWLRRDAEAAVQIYTVEGDTTYTLTAAPGIVHRIRVQAYDAEGRLSLPSEWSDPLYFEDELRGSDSLPGAASLRGNYPNPFNPETTIRYGVPENLTESTPMRLEIFALDGRRIRSFAIDRTPGWHEVSWNGTDERGIVQATGTYVTRFIVGADVATTKMTMLK
jgi:hypothetical protein